MATFIDLDSIWRDIVANPNPCNYELSVKQVETWVKSPKIVKPYEQNANTRPLSFVYTCNLINLTLPYSETLAAIPRVYLSLNSSNLDNVYTLNTIDNRYSDVTFVCVPRSVQNDSTGTPMWIHYSANMEQTIRFNLSFPLKFKITLRNGDTLDEFIQIDTTEPADPNLQSLATFNITPFDRDADYYPGIQPLTM